MTTEQFGDAPNSGSELQSATRSSASSATGLWHTSGGDLEPEEPELSPLEREIASYLSTLSGSFADSMNVAIQHRQTRLMQDIESSSEALRSEAKAAMLSISALADDAAKRAAQQHALGLEAIQKAMEKTGVRVQVFSTELNHQLKSLTESEKEHLRALADAVSDAQEEVSECQSLVDAVRKDHQLRMTELDRVINAMLESVQESLAESNVQRDVLSLAQKRVLSRILWTALVLPPLSAGAAIAFLTWM